MRGGSSIHQFTGDHRRGCDISVRSKEKPQFHLQILGTRPHLPFKAADIDVSGVFVMSRKLLL